MFVGRSISRGHSHGACEHIERSMASDCGPCSLKPFVSNGKPHQRYLAYLGSVQADRRDRPRFWYDVTRKLDQCRLPREERNRITSAIAKKIGGKVPTKAALKKFERRRAGLMG